MVISRGPFALAVALAVAVGALLLALMLRSAPGVEREDALLPAHVKAAPVPRAPEREEILARPETTASAITTHDEPVVVDLGASPSRTLLETTRAPSGIAVRGSVRVVRGTFRPETCAITLEDEEGRRLAPDVRQGTYWSFDSVPPGRWTLVAEADSFRPWRKNLLLSSGTSSIYQDIQLESASFVAVHLALLSPAAIAERLQDGTLSLSARKLRFVSTRAAPDRVVTTDAAVSGGESGVPTFRRRTNGVDSTLLQLLEPAEDLVSGEYADLSPDCAGVVPFESRSAFHLNLCLGTAVLHTVAIDPSTVRADFTVAPWDIDAACTSLALRVVDAERGLPLPATSASIADANGTTASASSGPDGRVRFEGVLPGWYALALRIEGRADLVERILVVAGRPNDLGDRRLELLATIRGFVVDEAGRPVQVNLLARPLGAVEEQRFVRAARAQSSADDGKFALVGLGRGPHVVLLAEGTLAARPVRVDTTRGDVLDVRIDAVRSTTVQIQFPQELRVGTLVRLDTLEALPVFASVLQLTREHLVRVAPGRYRLTATLEGRVLVDRQVEVGGEGSTLVVQPEKR